MRCGLFLLLFLLVFQIYPYDMLATQSEYRRTVTDPVVLNQIIKLLKMDSVTWVDPREPNEQPPVYLKLTSLKITIQQGEVILDGDIDIAQWSTTGLMHLDINLNNYYVFFLNSKGREIGQTQIQRIQNRFSFQIQFPIIDFYQISDFDILNESSYPLDDLNNPYYRYYPDAFVRVDDLQFLKIHFVRKKRTKTEIEERFDQQIKNLQDSSLDDVLKFLKLAKEMASVYRNSKLFPQNCGEISKVMMELMHVFNIHPIGFQVAPWNFNRKVLDHHVFLAFKVDGIVYFLDPAVDQNGWRSYIQIDNFYFENFRRLAPVVMPLGAVGESYVTFRELPIDQTEHLRFEDLSAYIPKKRFPNQFLFNETNSRKPLHERLTEQERDMFLWLVLQASHKGLLDLTNPALRYLDIYSFPGKQFNKVFNISA